MLGEVSSVCTCSVMLLYVCMLFFNWLKKGEVSEFLYNFFIYVCWLLKNSWTDLKTFLLERVCSCSGPIVLKLDYLSNSNTNLNLASIELIALVE